jgi:hypothetical protein
VPKANVLQLPFAQPRLLSLHLLLIMVDHGTCLTLSLCHCVPVCTLLLLLLLPLLLLLLLWLLLLLSGLLKGRLLLTVRPSKQLQQQWSQETTQTQTW